MARTFFLGAALAALAAAQTWTDCSPLNSTCSPDAALGTTFSTTFNKSMTAMNPQLWNVTAGGSHITFGNDGAQLGLYNKGDSVTVQSNFYMMWGQMEIVFKAAQGAGIISTGILISDDLDEIDWEVIGASETNVSANWYGHGDRNQNNAEHPNITSAPYADFHNYTVDWNKDRIQYWLDNQMVRQVNAAESGKYPQTPSFIRFGIWSAGDSDQPGTVQWAGGATDWSKAPYIMTVKSVRMTDGTQNASTYTYGDRSGSWDSIKVQNGQSQAYKVINKLSTTQSAMSSWNGLSTAAKIGIACGVIGFTVIGMIVWCAYCCVQRKKGREEKRIADQEWDAQQNELLAYKRMQQKGQFAVSHMSFSDNKF